MGLFEGAFAVHDDGKGGGTTGIWTTLAMVRSFGCGGVASQLNKVAAQGFRKDAEVSTRREHMIGRDGVHRVRGSVLGVNA